MNFGESTLKQESELRAELHARVSHPLTHVVEESARIQPNDKPGLLWHRCELEDLHMRLSEDFELYDRSAALDRRLTLIGETVETLLALIEAKRSRNLEIAIAIFIGMDLLAALYVLIFK